VQFAIEGAKNSLSLTISAGCNFPLWLSFMIKGEKFYCTEPRLGVTQRHLGKDLLWLYQNKEVKQWIKEFFIHRDFFDVEKISDPLPGWSYWMRNANRLRDWVWRRMTIAEYRRKEKGERERILSSFNCELHCLFVCRGNICRSPFAENFCREKLGWKNVRSCGTHPMSNRRVSEVAETVAWDDFCVDLTQHSSRVVEESLLRWADIIFVMDYRQLIELSSLAKGSVILLGAGYEITDPYRGNREIYQNCYRNIARACREIHAHVEVSHPTR